MGICLSSCHLLRCCFPSNEIQSLFNSRRVSYLRRAAGLSTMAQVSIANADMHWLVSWKNADPHWWCDKECASNLNADQHSNVFRAFIICASCIVHYALCIAANNATLAKSIAAANGATVHCALCIHYLPP